MVVVASGMASLFGRRLALGLYPVAAAAEFAAVPAFDHVERPFTAGHVEDQDFSGFGVALDGVQAVFGRQGVEPGHVADDDLALQGEAGAVGAGCGEDAVPVSEVGRARPVPDGFEIDQTI